jgi:hypothetical protein
MINHNSNSSNTNHIIIMFVIMVVASVITGMNMWVNNLSDVRLHLNDVYMGISMTGWMLFLMGLIYSMENYIWIGIGTIGISAYLIRKQTFIGTREYIDSMIPHHSMAILMSKQLKEKGEIQNKQLDQLVNNIIQTQQEEINLMKSL